ncbi:MAG: primosomal protein N' [Planctomycetaceae bacterium]|nr:primosomal protein N' [Planctomycetaceae bacterium]
MKTSQLSLFDNGPPEWEQDDVTLEWVAGIVFPTGLTGSLDYRIPEPMQNELQPGMRVTVPLGKGNREQLGYCIAAGQKETAGRKLKEILTLVDSRRLLSEKMLKLTAWMAESYLCPWGVVLDAVLPVGVRDSAGTRLTSVLLPAEDYQKKLDILAKSPKGKNLLTPKQKQVLETLLRSEVSLTAAELARMAKCSMAPIQHLKTLGFFRVKHVRRERKMETPPVIPRVEPHQLNPDQQRALNMILEAVHQNRHETFLLHGVTGSGKTEVYIRAMEDVVKNGRQAVVLVPEISLTPQTVLRFRERFDRVAVLHSHLTDAERHREWQQVASGEIQVVVGARSAVFAPVPRLGLMILDEEHESSFKQDVAPRYHARDVAQQRAAEENVPLVLGSATPSLESWYRAKKKEYRLIAMPHRVRNRPLPYVGTIDLRTGERGRMTRGALHPQMHLAIQEALDQNGQVILLLNRRGFSTHIQCPACGEVMKCPDCDVTLTHHQAADVAICHYCDYQIPAPSKCPKCGFTGIRYGGFGTQKLEMEIKARFPGTPLLRMDTDTMQGHGAHERALTQFREGNVRILLGTQMIAKGLDFPNVTLVGVINADTAIHLPDFRASERTFHLITQVAGRTGRGDREGLVLVQTYNPDHPAIVAAAKHDYHQFVSQELPMREALGYPPFTRLARFVVRGPAERVCHEFAVELAERLRQSTEELELKSRLLGPAPAPFSKLRGNFRFHLHLHALDADKLRAAVRQAADRLKSPDGIQWMVDLDPLDML